MSEPTEFEKQHPEIPIIGTISDEDLGDKIEEAFRDPHCDMNRNRPYDGQPWTNAGERGKKEVKGITMRDVQDCFVRAVLLSAHHVVPALYHEAEKGEAAKLNTDSVYVFDLDKLDPMAIAQNLTCEIERMMGIFPNIPEELKAL